jgi:hypothetical protein
MESRIYENTLRDNAKDSKCHPRPWKTANLTSYLLICSFGYFPGVRLFCRRFGTLCQVHLQRLDVEYEVWMVRGFWNVGKTQSDVSEPSVRSIFKGSKWSMKCPSEIPKRTYTRFRTRRKFEIKKLFTPCSFFITYSHHIPLHLSTGGLENGGGTYLRENTAWQRNSERPSSTAVKTRKSEKLFTPCSFLCNLHALTSHTWLNIHKFPRTLQIRIQSDQKVSVHLMITTHKVISNVSLLSSIWRIGSRH